MKSVLITTVLITSMFSLAFSQYVLEWSSPDGLDFGELLDQGTIFPAPYTIADFNEDGIQELIVGDSLNNMYVYDMVTYELLFQYQFIIYADFYGFANITDEPTKEFVMATEEGDWPNVIRTVYFFNTVTNESTVVASGDIGWSLSIWSCNCGSDVKDKLCSLMMNIFRFGVTVVV